MLWGFCFSSFSQQTKKGLGEHLFLLLSLDGKSVNLIQNEMQKIQ